MSVHPKAYRQRLLYVLVSQDIRIIMTKLGETNMDLINSRYWLLDHWDSRFEIEENVMRMVKERIA